MQALETLRVVDVSTIFAGPLAATLLGDFGADVVKIEHPQRGDSVRSHGPALNGIPLAWKQISRNKKAVAVDLSRPEGQEILLRLLSDADVLVENFRPGTLDRWNLGFDRLHSINSRLIIASVTGFGQFGPRANEPGFGTLAEAMSGFAAMTGEPDGPPTLPPYGLADGIAGIATAFAIMVAIAAREQTGEGQAIDVALIEPILTVLGTQITAYKALGLIPKRTGNRSSINAPRNTYRTRDDRWLAVSTSAQSVAERLVSMIGHEEFVAEEWFATGRGRVEHVEELDRAVRDWIAARDADEVVEAFSRAQAAVAPIYDIADIIQDPQYLALETVVEIADDELGTVAMQNILCRLSDTPGQIRWPGPHLGAHTDEVLGRLGYSEERLAALRSEGVIA